MRRGAVQALDVHHSPAPFTPPAPVLAPTTSTYIQRPLPPVHPHPPVAAPYNGAKPVGLCREDGYRDTNCWVCALNSDGAERERKGGVEGCGRGSVRVGGHVGIHGLVECWDHLAPAQKLEAMVDSCLESRLTDVEYGLDGLD
eukprot:scaffold75103_cov18-Tisochrysis_lutea.AAC.6